MEVDQPINLSYTFVKNILIVGSGFSGAVVASELAKTDNFKILVIDERSHLAGNCHSERDADTNIMEHVYGPHIFNTSSLKVWEYIQRFTKFHPYTNRVKAVTDRGLFSLPINLLTINSFFGKAFNPREAFEFIKSLSKPMDHEPKNFEEQAINLVGEELYENFFKGYTIKQWGVHPTELPASILKRLPVRFNYDDNYYNTIYQGLPDEGYTVIVERMLTNPNIRVQLGTRYESGMKMDFDYVFYSGPIDAYFNFRHGRLGYRTIFFEKNLFNGEDYQGNPVINYCSERDPYTRIHEHKYFSYWEKNDRSILLKEFSKETEPSDTPYYPKRLMDDMEKLIKYRALGELEENITFIGRLGTYRYLDMHHVIGESLLLADEFIHHKSHLQVFKRFINQEA